MHDVTAPNRPWLSSASALWLVGQVLSELGVYGDTVGGGATDGSAGDVCGARCGAAAGVAGAAIPRLVPHFLRSLVEVHYIDAGLNCRGAYMTDPRTADGIGVLAAAARQRGCAAAKRHLHVPGRPSSPKPTGHSLCPVSHAE
jgi:hypothetical protein